MARDCHQADGVVAVVVAVVATEESAGSAQGNRSVGQSTQSEMHGSSSLWLIWWGCEWGHTWTSGAWLVLGCPSAWLRSSSLLLWRRLQKVLYVLTHHIWMHHTLTTNMQCTLKRRAPVIFYGRMKSVELLSSCVQDVHSSSMATDVEYEIHTAICPPKMGLLQGCWGKGPSSRSLVSVLVSEWKSPPQTQCEPFLIGGTTEENATINSATMRVKGNETSIWMDVTQPHFLAEVS